MRSARVGAQWHYDERLRELIRDNLGRHERRALAEDGRRRAAVAIVLIDSVSGTDLSDEYAAAAGDMTLIPGGAGALDGSMVSVAGGASFILCRRAAGLTRHASQWALPGGRAETGESAAEAARRELEEEVGLSLRPDSVLGELDDYATRSGFIITPVVFWAGGHVELSPDPQEVLAAYRIGLHQLLREDSPRFVEIPESDRPVVQIPLGNDLIHAPTGAILLQLRWLGLEGRRDPVAHLEQPVFAWH